jgi:hypothetical protein
MDVQVGQVYIANLHRDNLTFLRTMGCADIVVADNSSTIGGFQLVELGLGVKLDEQVRHSLFVGSDEEPGMTRRSFFEINHLATPDELYALRQAYMRRKDLLPLLDPNQVRPDMRRHPLIFRSVQDQSVPSYGGESGDWHIHT